MPDDREGFDDTLLPSTPGTEPTIAHTPAPGTEPTIAHTPAPGLNATLAHGTKSSAPTVPGVVTSGGATIARLDTERYRMGELLGRGGMGEVVLATDEQLGREVAIKRIRAEYSSGELLSRFLREARVQGRLQHPAIVPVHDLAFDKEGRPYFVMKRLSGTTLADLLRSSSTEDAAARLRLLRAFIDVCMAIEFAHASGIVHRDLKPANIILGDFGEVYVLDWGVARAITDGDDTGTTNLRVSNELDLKLDGGETQAGTVLGTPAYMAPEQATGERAGPAADIYALGCILFEIVAGRPLHEGRRSLATLATPIDANPSRLRPDSAPELDAVCTRATKLDPGERFPTARALADAVQAFLDGDRDLALRKEHAKRHIVIARDALATKSGEEARRVAMREAGRALALDPTATEAADIVTQLMLKPPEQVPAEVDARVAANDLQLAQRQGTLASVATLGYLAFVPMMLWTGVRDMTLVFAFIAAALALGGQLWYLSRRSDITRAGIYTSVVLNTLVVAVVSRIMGPFMIVPTIVMTTLMAYAAHPRFGSIRNIAMILASGIAIPWILEVTGVIAPTYRFTEAGELVMSSTVVNYSSVPVQLSFASLILVFVVLVAVLVRGMANQQRQAARTIELQAWHLRQLVPTRD